MSKGRRARRRARAKRTPADLGRGARILASVIDEPFQLPQPPPSPAAALPARVPAPPSEVWPPVAPPPATQPFPTELVYPRQVPAEELTGGKDDTTLTAELASKLREIPACQHCGGRHVRACPRVRRMSFHPTGSLAEVEFWPEGRWSDADIIWPEDLPET